MITFLEYTKVIIQNNLFPDILLISKYSSHENPYYLCVLYFYITTRISTTVFHFSQKNQRWKNII